MDINGITEEWKNDSAIDTKNLLDETLKSPSLHQKYLNLLLQAKNKVIKIENEYLYLRNMKYKYYRGEMSKQELDALGWQQFQGLKPLKQDMQVMIEHDADMNNISNKIKYMNNMVYQLESILNTIKGRDWAIKNHIELMKFMAGN